MGRNRQFRVTTQIARHTPDHSKPFNAGHTLLFSAPLRLATELAAKAFTHRLFSLPTLFRIIPSPHFAYTDIIKHNPTIVKHFFINKISIAKSRGKCYNVQGDLYVCLSDMQKTAQKA